MTGTAISTFLAAPPSRWLGICVAVIEVTFAVVRWIHPADMKWRAHVVPPPLVAFVGLVVAANPTYPTHGTLLVGLIAYAGYLVYRLADFMPVSLHIWLGKAKGRLAKWRAGRSVLRLLTRPWRRMWGQTSAWLVAFTALTLVNPTLLQAVVSLLGAGAILWLRRPWDREWLPALLAPAAICWVALLISVADYSLNWAEPANSELITELVASQLVLAVIPVTIAAVGMQFAVQWIGLRGLGVVPYGWISGVLFSLVLSLSADILAVNGIRYDSRGSAYLELVALAELVAAALLIALIVRRMEPEIVTARLAGSLSDDWAIQVLGASQAFGSFFRPLHRDRFNALERVLYRSAVLEGEVELFRNALRRLRWDERHRQGAVRRISIRWVFGLLAGIRVQDQPDGLIVLRFTVRVDAPLRTLALRPECGSFDGELKTAGTRVERNQYVPRARAWLSDRRRARRRRGPNLPKFGGNIAKSYHPCWKVDVLGLDCAIGGSRPKRIVGHQPKE